MKPARALKLVAAGIATVAIAGIAVLAFLFYTSAGRESLRGMLVTRLNSQVTGRLTIGALEGALPNAVVLRDLALTDSAGSLVFGAKRLAANINVLQLFSKRIDVSRMELDTATLMLRHHRGGAWNVARVFARPDRDPTSSDRGGGFGHWLRIRDARVTGAHVVVRVPWVPDGDAPLSADSSAKLLDRERARVEHTPDGFEQVMEFRNIDAEFARVLVVHPDTARIVAEVRRASMIAEPFRPPAAEIRDLGGTLVVTSDSLRFLGWRVVLPDSRMTVEVRYAPTTGGLRGRLRADPVQFRDLQWLHPSLPGEGRGSLTISATRESDGPLELRATDIVAQIGAASGAGSVAMTVGDTLRLVGADVRVTAVDTDLAARLLPNVEIPVDGTVDAEARVDSTAAGYRTDAAVTFRERSGARSHVTTRGIITVGETLGTHELDVRLAPLQTRIIRAFAPTARVRGTLAGRARISGTMRRGWHIDGDLSHVDAGARSRFVGTVHAVPSARHVRIDGRVAPLALIAVERAAPGLQLRGVATGPVRATLAGDSVAFVTGLRIGEGTLDASGGIGWRDGVSYDVRIEPRGLDPKAISRRAPAGLVTGVVTVRGRGVTARTADGEVSLALDDSRLDRVTVDSLRLSGNTSNGVATIDTLTAWQGPTRVAGGGTVALVADRTGELRYAATTDSLGSLVRAIAPDSQTYDNGSSSTGTLAPNAFAGRAEAAGSITGNIDSLRIAGRALFGEPRVSNFAAAGASAEYTLGLRGEDTVSVVATVDTARASGLAYERVELRVAGTRRQLAADLRIRQDAHVQLTATADVALDSSASGAPAPNGVLELRDLTLGLPSGKWRSARPARVTWRGEALEVDSLAIQGPNGSAIELTGGLPASGDGALQLRVTGLFLTDVSALRQADLRADGRLGLELGIAGNTRAPRATGSSVLDGLVIRGDSIPPIRSTLAYADARLRFDATLGAGAEASIVTGHGELPIDLALIGVSGSRLDRNGAMLVELRADSVPLTALPRRRAVAVEGGWARGAVDVRGTVADPVVRGTMDVRDGAAYVPQAGITVRDVVAAARLTNDSLVIDSLVARSNGRIHASGFVARSGRGERRVVATITGRDAAVLGGSLGDLHTDADLAISGTTDSIVVTGRAEVLHGFIERKGPGEQALRVAAAGDPELFAILDTSAIVRRSSEPVETESKRSIHADVAVRINPGVWYRSAPNAKVEVYTPRDLRVRGDVLAADLALGGAVVTRGGVYVFRLRPFTIIRGGATLAGASGVAPLIQATGEHDAWIVGRGIVPVRFIASGFPASVQFSLGDASTLPAAPADVANYLSLGRPPVSLLQTEGSSLSGLSTSSGRFTGDLGALVRRQQVSPALGAILYQLAKGARDAADVRLFSVAPTDLPPELAESRYARVRGTTLEGGYLFGSRTYVAARIRLSAVSPGVVVVHSLASDFYLRAAYEPLFRLGAPPTLGPPQHGVLRRAFGAFLTKEWWF